MSQQPTFSNVVTLLPETLARALVADADCQVAITPADEGKSTVKSGTSTSEFICQIDGEHSRLYRLGDGFIAFEMTAENISEVISFPIEYLQTYLNSIFVDKSITITYTSDVVVDFSELLIDRY